MFNIFALRNSGCCGEERIELCFLSAVGPAVQLGTSCLSFFCLLTCSLWVLGSSLHFLTVSGKPSDWALARQAVLGLKTPLPSPLKQVLKLLSSPFLQPGFKEYVALTFAHRGSFPICCGCRKPLLLLSFWLIDQHN